MGVDPLEIVDTAESRARQEEARNSRINTVVAITVAILATFMGICKIKDDNIVQAMQQAQADKIDHWSYYQARHIREDLARSTALQLRLAKGNRPDADQAAYDAQVADLERVASEQATKKTALMQQAQQDQQTYDSLNYRDDQFDLSDAALAIAISLLAVTALTHLWWLYALSLLPITFGVSMGLAGLFGWPLHPDGLVRLLS
jgi:hypothetical protein